MRSCDADAGPAGRAVTSRVTAEASGCLVAPPVFKTGERCAAALAGSIPVRLRYLRNAVRKQVRAFTLDAISMIVQPPVGTMLARRGTKAAIAAAAASPSSSATTA